MCNIFRISAAAYYAYCDTKRRGISDDLVLERKCCYPAGYCTSEKWTLIEGRGETDADVSAGGLRDSQRRALCPAGLGIVPSGIRLQAIIFIIT